MIVPGFSTPRIPASTRLFISIGLTLLLTPPLLPSFEKLPSFEDSPHFIQILVQELIIGFVMGMLLRLFFLSLETFCVAIAFFIGATNIFTSVEDSEALPPLASFLSLSALILIFVTDQHWEMIRGFIQSYHVLPPGDSLSTRWSLIRITDTLREAFLIGLRLSSPFILFAFLFQLATGLLARVAPQIPTYFVFMPMGILLGLLILYGINRSFLSEFLSQFSFFIISG